MGRYSQVIGIGLAAAVAVSCAPSDDDSDASDRSQTLARMQPDVQLPEPTLRRLTQEQYRNAAAALLGTDIILPTSLEPDEATDGLQSIGASLTTISPRGVEQYERAAFDMASQALATESGRARLVPCTPAAAVDVACAEEFVSTFGREAWRRPLTEEELETLVEITGDAAVVYGDFYQGLV